MKNLILVLLFITTQGYSQTLSPLKKNAVDEVIKLHPQIKEISEKLWNYSEIALEEVKSSALLIDILQKEGFAIEKNIGGMPTAFIARWGSGGPKLGILAEYDALSGVGNQALPEKISRTDGITSGHGCGHNLFAAGSVSAGIALKRTMQSKNVPGTIVVFGTPAEETLIGKVFMAREKVFNGFDAVLEWHPFSETKAGFERTLAMNSFEVEFFGKPAHGAIDPWNGRSALDAVEMMNYGVNMMREHIHPTARIHYVITNGGDVPNVVPAYAKVWYFVRDTARADAENYYNRILKIAEGAAMSTETTFKVNLLSGVHEYNLNEPLLVAIQKNMETIGAPKFTEEENKWGAELQKAAGKDPKGFTSKINELPANWKTIPTGGGSTDVAEVSFISPTAGFWAVTAPLGLPWHSWSAAASHGTETALKGAEFAAKVLAITGIDILTNEALRKSAMQYFLQKTGGKAYKSPLPDSQKVILPVIAGK